MLEKGTIRRLRRVWRSAWVCAPWLAASVIAIEVIGFGDSAQFQSLVRQYRAELLEWSSVSKRCAESDNTESTRRSCIDEVVDAAIRTTKTRLALREVLAADTARQEAVLSRFARGLEL